MLTTKDVKNKTTLNEIKEVWKNIEDFEGQYQISNFGRIKSLDRYVIDSNGKSFFRKGQILKQTKDKDGYLQVSLKKHSKGYTRKIHRLVAINFIENQNNYPEVNHKDEVKQNNHVSNLEWCTHKYNNNYGTKNERCRISQGIKIYGENINNGEKLYFDSISEVEKSGFRKDCVSDCIAKRKRVKTHKGYKWFKQ